MVHSDCGWTCGCAGKTVRSPENTCHTWALLRWWFTKRRYIKCTYLYLCNYLLQSSRKFKKGQEKVKFVRVSRKPTLSSKMKYINSAVVSRSTDGENACMERRSSVVYTCKYIFSNFCIRWYHDRVFNVYCSTTSLSNEWMNTLLFFYPRYLFPREDLKIDENKLIGYDAQSVQSGTGRLSCSRTALKRCTSTETRWYKWL